MVDIGSAMIGGATGVIGSVIGAAVNELLRRSNRIESYSAKIFDKRLAAYEALFEHMHKGYDIASEMMSDESLSGVVGINRLLKRVARPKLSGEFIDYLRAQRRALSRC